MLGSIVQICAGSLCTEEQAKDVEKFFKDKDTKVCTDLVFDWDSRKKLTIFPFSGDYQGYDMSIAQCLDAIRAKAAWVKRDEEDVEQWLKGNGYLEEKGRF